MFRRLAFITLALAGCGKVEAYTDAAPVDGTAADAVATGTVNIVALEYDDQPNGHTAGVEVFVTGRDGSLGDRATTDANGEATLDLSGGDSVTAVFPRSASATHFVQTVVNVAPDDTLTFGYNVENYTIVGGPMTLTWPAAPNIGSYVAYGGCYGVGVGTATTAQVSRYSPAQCGGTQEFTVLGYDATSGLLSYTSHASAPWTDNGSLQMPALTPALNYSISISGLPDFITSVYLNAYVQFGSGSSYGGSAYASGTPTGGALSGTGQLAAGAPYVQLSYSVYRDNFGGQYGGERKTPPGNSAALSAPAFLPWVGQVIVNTRAREIAWIQDDSGADPADVLEAYASWYMPAAAANLGTTGDRVEWHVIAPPNAPARIGMVEPPSDLADLTETVTTPSGNLTYIESDDVDGWREVLSRPLYRVTCPDCVTAADPMPKVRYAGSGGGQGK